MNPSTWSTRQVLALATRRTRRTTALGSGLLAGHQLCEAAVPVTVGLVIDRAVTRGDLASALRWVLVLLVLFAVLSIAWQLASWFVVKAQQRTEHEVRLAVVERVLDPRGRRDRAGTGETLSLATSDAARVALVVEVVAVLVGAGAALLVGALVLLRTSLLLGAVALLAVVLVVALTPALSRPLQRRSDAEQDAVARASGLATDLVDGLRPLTGLGAGEAAAARYRVVSQQSRQARIAAARAEGALLGASTALSGLLLVVVAAVGAHQVLDGALTPGEFISSVGLAQFLVGAVERFTGALVEVARVRASAQRVGAVLGAPFQVEGPSSPLESGGRGGLELRGVQTGSLRGLHLRVPAGQVLAVVADDADAADLLDLLSRRRDPEQGAVLLDGVPVRELALDALHAAVRVSPHDADLFGETVPEALGVPADEVAALLDVVAGADVLAAAGLTEPLGERGRTLSGGQRQRLALARALAGDPDVLVLHDPTTAVDSATEALIAQGLRRHRAGRTTVLLTTSPALLAAADRVVLVSDGVVADDGDHERLSSHPAYAALVLA